MTTEFQPFPKIPRWSRDIIITEKIDGTNACVVVEDTWDDPHDTVNTVRVLAQSRSRFITPDADNYGFAAWVREHAEELKGLGPGRHFGEWWGRGINRNYGISDRRFSLFNVCRWDKDVSQKIEAGKFRKPGEEVLVYAPPPACCGVVPVLYHGEMVTHFLETYCNVTGTLDHLSCTGSVAAPGWMKPEGIVIFHTASGHLFKKTLENDERAKGAQ